MRDLFAAGYTTASAANRRGGAGIGGGAAGDGPHLYGSSTAAPSNADRRYMSYAELQHLSAQQHDEVLFLRNENNNLKSREIEISALSVRLQQQFAATQAQIDHLKATVRLQLLNPIGEAEYIAIEQKAESDRDLIDTLKLGIYQQIGSLRAAKDTAVRRASELALELEQTGGQLRAARQDHSDAQHAREGDAAETKRLRAAMEAKTALELEHMARIKDLEHRLRSATAETDRATDARVGLQHKVAEVARLEMLLRQEEASVARHKASLDCADQKLDILKSEYYELKLSYGQKVLQLENALRNAEEKLSLVADVELEAEVFIANMATREEVADGARTGGTTNEGGSPLAVVPPSRRLAHALTITKKCLALENKVASLEHDLRHKDEAIAKLTKSLEMAKSALGAQHGAGSQYSLIEKTVDRLLAEKEGLEARNKVLLDENTVLTAQVKDQAADLKVLTRHREELVLIREQLAEYAAALGDATVAAARSGVGVAGRARGTPSPSATVINNNRTPLSPVDLNAKPTASIMKSSLASPSSSPQQHQQFLSAANVGSTSPPHSGAAGTGSVRFAEGLAAGGSFSVMGASRNGGGGSGLHMYNSFNPEVSDLTSAQQQQQQQRANSGGTASTGLPHPLQHLAPIPISVNPPTPAGSLRIMPSAAGLQNLPSIISIGGGGSGHVSPTFGGGGSGGGAAASMGSMSGLRVRKESHPDIPFCQSIVIN